MELLAVAAPECAAIQNRLQRRMLINPNGQLFGRKTLFRDPIANLAASTTLFNPALCEQVRNEGRSDGYGYCAGLYPSARSKMLHELPFAVGWQWAGFGICHFELFLCGFCLGRFPQTHPRATTIFVDELDAGGFQSLPPLRVEVPSSVFEGTGKVWVRCKTGQSRTGRSVRPV